METGKYYATQWTLTHTAYNILDDDPMIGCGMATADRCYGLLPHDGSRPTYLHEVILDVIPKFK